MSRPLPAALAAALGLALADFTYALFAFSAGSGLALLLQSHRQVFRTASSGLLLALGLWLFAGVMRRPLGAGAATSAAPPGNGLGLVRLYLLTLANPLTVLLFVGFSGQMAVSGGPAAAIGDAAFLFLGSLSAQAGYAAFGAGLQRLIRHPRALHTLNAAGTLAVAAFGAYGMWKGA